VEFSFDAKTEELRNQLLSFMESHVYPAESIFVEQVRNLKEPWTRPPIVEELKGEARSRGLWNLFLPHGKFGAGLSNLQYASLAEITGRSPFLAPEALNCAAPDTGNMELLALFGTSEQQEQWLRPLLNGEIRSAFSMTEPEVASSDATNISTTISRDGDEYVINGTKWWSSGGMSPNCRMLIVMGVTNKEAPTYQRQSMIIVPRETPGVEVKRSTSIFGFTEEAHGGHAEIAFHDVRVPISNLLGEEGSGFRLAQERLGPGRIHHCMRLLGMAERAFDMMCARVVVREAFGGPLANQGVVQEWIAESRIKMEQLRLLILKTAWLMDTVGSKSARIEISAIKVAAPEVATWVIDRSIQAHGGGGMSQDYLLGAMYVQARTLHIADGPDEVHRRSIARNELRRYRTPESISQ
jgi:acyl-CoA dehydrogenase